MVSLRDLNEWPEFRRARRLVLVHVASAFAGLSVGISAKAHTRLFWWALFVFVVLTVQVHREALRILGRRD